MRSFADHLGHFAAPLGPASARRVAALVVLIAVVPASGIGAVTVWVAATSGARWSAVAVALAPILLAFLIGRWAWPQDEDRWAATVRVALACGALWFGGFIGVAFFFETSCGSLVITPALLAGAAVYAALCIATIRDGDFAFLTWPVVVIAGLAVIIAITAAGPHGVCVN